MTEVDRLLLNELTANVHQLFQEYKNLKSENEMLKRRLEDAAGKFTRHEQEKTELTKKIEKMKMANLILAGNDKDGKARKKINALIREVDKCIALLNK
jgi:regulator of replication initiation timing